MNHGIFRVLFRRSQWEIPEFGSDAESWWQIYLFIAVQEAIMKYFDDNQMHSKYEEACDVRKSQPGFLATNFECLWKFGYHPTKRSRRPGETGVFVRLLFFAPCVLLLPNYQRALQALANCLRNCSGFNTSIYLSIYTCIYIYTVDV